MSTNYSPSIVRDGLVLMLDAANDKSFKGIPAVNCAKALINWDADSSRTVTEVTDISPQRSGARVFKIVLNATSNFRFSNYYSGGGFGGTATNPLILGKTGPNFTTVGSSIGNVKYRFGFWICGKSTNGSSYCTIDIGDRNGATVNINNNTTWQFISTTDAAGVNSDSYPYDFFDMLFVGSVGDTFYMYDLMIVRSIGTVDSLPNLDSYPSFIDYQQTRGSTVATDGGFADLSSRGNHHTVSANLIYNTNPSRITLDQTNGFTYNASLTTSTLCTVVIFYKTTDTTELWVRGNNDGSYYLCAADGAGAYYHSNVGTPTNYVDLNVVTVPSSYRNGNYHMWEAKNVNFSTWTSFQWFLYGGSWNLLGDVSIILVYDRPLSASESAQNFNALKKRFGI